MADADILDVGETLEKLFSFWLFLFSRRFRQARVARFRAASLMSRALMLLEGVIATVVGLGLPSLVIWFIAT